MAKSLRHSIPRRPWCGRFPTPDIEPQSAARRFVLTRDQHVSDDGATLGRRRSIYQFRQRGEHIDQKILGVAIVGIGVRGEGEVLSLDLPCATDAEELGERLEKSRLTCRVRTNYCGDLSA
jgi:hypothetical protein